MGKVVFKPTESAQQIGIFAEKKDCGGSFLGNAFCYAIRKCANCVQEHVKYVKLVGCFRAALPLYIPPIQPYRAELGRNVEIRLR